MEGNDTMIGAWVKIPGLGPNETGALHYLDVEQLHKLRDRVEKALDMAERKTDQLDRIRPGWSCYTTKRVGAIPAHCHGYVLSRDQLIDADLVPDDKVPVCFYGYGLHWVPVTLLEF